MPVERWATAEAEGLGRRGIGPRSARQIGAWVETEFGLAYEGRSGLIALLHRLGLKYRKPEAIARKRDEKKRHDFIESYERLLNSLPRNEAVLFADAGLRGTGEPLSVQGPVWAARQGQ